MTCGYEGSHFGARYPDATCIDGYLWDLDSCEQAGSNVLTQGGDKGCPCCNTKRYLEYCGFTASGNAHQRRRALRVAIAKVKEWAK